MNARLIMDTVTIFVSILTEAMNVNVAMDTDYWPMDTVALISMSVWKRQHVVTVYVIMKKVDIHVAVMMVISCQEITALVKIRTNALLTTEVVITCATTLKVDSVVRVVLDIEKIQIIQVAAWISTNVDWKMEAALKCALTLKEAMNVTVDRYSNWLLMEKPVITAPHVRHLKV